MSDEDATPADGVENEADSGTQAADDLIGNINKEARVVSADQLKDRAYKSVSKDQLRNMILDLIRPFVGPEVRELLGDIAQIQLKLPGVQEKNQGLEQEILALNEKISVLEAEFERLTARLKTLSDEVEGELAAIDARVPELIAEIEGFETEWKDADREAEALRAKIAEIEERLKILQNLANVADPAARIRELEDITEQLTEQRQELLRCADYYDAGEVYEPGALEGIAGGLRQRISGLARTSEEGKAGAQSLSQAVDVSEAGMQAAAAGLDRMVMDMNRDDGTVFLMAEMVRLSAEMKTLRERLDLAEIRVIICRARGCFRATCSRAGFLWASSRLS